MDAVAESGLEGVCGRGGLKISFGALPLWLETKSQMRMRVRGWVKRRRKQGSLLWLIALNIRIVKRKGANVTWWSVGCPECMVADILM